MNEYYVCIILCKVLKAHVLALECTDFQTVLSIFRVLRTLVFFFTIVQSNNVRENYREGFRRYLDANRDDFDVDFRARAARGRPLKCHQRFIDYAHSARHGRFLNKNPEHDVKFAFSIRFRPRPKSLERNDVYLVHTCCGNR